MSISPMAAISRTWVCSRWCCRRCRLIICTDAGADPEYQYADIGNAVRKIRIDLGISIEFDSMPVHRQRTPDDHTGRYCYLGRIRYSCVDGAEAPDGIVICFKPVLCGNEPQDVLNYGAQNPVFPQEPTSDQFFGESQFESYRRLGEFAVETVFGEQAAPALPFHGYDGQSSRRADIWASPRRPNTWVGACLDRAAGAKSEETLPPEGIGMAG